MAGRRIEADFPQLKCRVIGGPHNGETYEGHVCNELYFWETDGQHIYVRRGKQRNFRFLRTVRHDDDR